MNVDQAKPQSNRTAELHRPAINSMTFGGSTLMHCNSEFAATLLICLEVIIVPQKERDKQYECGSDSCTKYLEIWVRSVDTPPLKKDSLRGNPFFLLIYIISG